MTDSVKLREALEDLFELTIKERGSDLHLKADSPPLIRIDGELIPQENYPALSSDMITKLVYSTLTEEQIKRFEEEMELDFAVSTKSGNRFRSNIMKERGNIGAVFRAIPTSIPSIEELGLPSQVKDIASLKRGLVLVTGPTGSGKSTTLAAIINRINETRRCHIVTIEDPIEFLHEDKMAVIKQREVGVDTLSFNSALRHVLRQDPDVILIGEMRDLDSISIALTAAETGHLVLSTLHTQTSPTTINRIIDVFPEESKDQVRQQLSNTLQAIISQQLIPSASGVGRVVAVEYLIATPAIRHQIRDGKEHQIYSTMEAAKGEGMITMDTALAELYKSGKITRQHALEYCVDRKTFTMKLKAV